MAPEVERRGVRARSVQAHLPLSNVRKGVDEGLTLIAIESALTGELDRPGPQHLLLQRHLLSVVSENELFPLGRTQIRG
jgi:hypothetical protein